MIPYLYGSLSFCQYRLNDSSIVFEVIRTISIFYEKVLSTQKHLTTKNQLPKQKQTNQKQQRNNFSRKKLLRGGGDSLFCILVFFYAQNIFVKKNKQV